MPKFRNNTDTHNTHFPIGSKSSQNIHKRNDSDSTRSKVYPSISISSSRINPRVNNSENIIKHEKNKVYEGDNVATKTDKNITETNVDVVVDRTTNTIATKPIQNNNKINRENDRNPTENNKVDFDEIVDTESGAAITPDVSTNTQNNTSSNPVLKNEPSSRRIAPQSDKSQQHLLLSFLANNDVVGLGLGTILGIAVTSLVNSFSRDVIIPIVNPLLGTKQWEDLTLKVGSKIEIKVGKFIFNVMYFVILIMLGFAIVMLLSPHLSRYQDANDRSQINIMGRVEDVLNTMNIQLQNISFVNHEILNALNLNRSATQEHRGPDNIYIIDANDIEHKDSLPQTSSS